MSFGIGSGPSLAPGNPGNARLTQNPLVALITALGQLPQMRQQQQLGQSQVEQAKAQVEQAKAQAQYAPQLAAMDLETRRAQMDQTKRLNAQQGIDSMKPILLRNPHYASDPNVKQRFMQFYSDLGVPPPLDALGNIDLNALKMQPGDPRYAQVVDFGQSLQAGPVRKAYYDAQQIYYTPEMISAAAALTPKDQALIMRAKSLGVHEGNLDTAMQHRLQIQQEVADAQTSLNAQRAQKLRNDMMTSTMNAQTRLQDANTAQYRAMIEGKRLEQSIQQFNYNANLHAQTLVGQQARAVESEAGKLDSQIDQVQQQIITATNDNVDASVIKQLNGRLSALQGARDGLNKLLQAANEIQATNLGAAGTVQQASGARRATVEDPGGQKRVVNGKTYVKRADGLWYPQ